MNTPVMLVVLDGFGVGDGGTNDATAVAHTPFLDRARAQYPTARVETSGKAVGLPPGQMGNSEVGHMTMGAGRIIEQDLARVGRALARGDHEKIPAVQDALRAVRESGGTLHLMGLVSDGGVHSHIDHLVALLRHCSESGVAAAVHAFLDGRDTPPRSGLGFLRDLMPRVEAAGAHVSTVMGRYFAMDRDNRWERVSRAYHALVCREGHGAASALHAIEAAYARDENDEFVEPTVIAGGAAIRDGDAVLFFNFRADRAREITNALSGVAPQRFEGELERRAVVRLSSFVCMTEYDADFGLPVVFPPFTPAKILGELLATRGLAQLRIAETEKYPHVTFFFNGGVEVPFPGEDRFLIPSPRDVTTYDQKPEMSAPQVTEEVVTRIGSGDYDFILLNFANPDMVGHTGVEEAAVRAVETGDACLGRILEALDRAGGAAVVTADHGNCEVMWDEENDCPHTAHSLNDTPCVVAAPGYGGPLRGGGALCDVAPTLLGLMGVGQPPEMTGRDLRKP